MLHFTMVTITFMAWPHFRPNQTLLALAFADRRDVVYVPFERPAQLANELTQSQVLAEGGQVGTFYRLELQASDRTPKAIGIRSLQLHYQKSVMERTKYVQSRPVAQTPKEPIYH